MRYFDNCATTIIDEKVIQEMNKAFREEFYNPSSLYGVSTEIKIKINQARKAVADLIMCDKDDIYFTGSGTEANNMAIFGSLGSRKGTIVTSMAEHSSVYKSIAELKNRGFDVIYAPLNPDGSVKTEQFEDLIDDNTLLVALMHVNNETGAVSDIKTLCKKAKSKNSSCVFVCDGVQAAGKIRVNAADLGIDFYTMAAHKLHGPKGIGALYMKRDAKIKPIIFGGGQEKGLRPGTENVAAIYGFGCAAQDAASAMEQNWEKFKHFKQIILNEFQSNVPDFFQVAENSSAPHVLTMALADIKSQILLHLLESKGIFIGNGSACSSKSVYSRVGEAINLPRRYLEGIVRICFSKHNTEESVRELAFEAAKAVTEIRRLTGGTQ